MVEQVVVYKTSNGEFFDNEAEAIREEVWGGLLAHLKANLDICLGGENAQENVVDWLKGYTLYIHAELGKVISAANREPK